jgi:hypothetical protein
MTFSEIYDTFFHVREKRFDRGTIEIYLKSINQLHNPIVKSHKFSLMDEPFDFIPYDFLICKKCLSCWVGGGEFGYVSPIAEPGYPCPELQGVGTDKITLSVYSCSTCGDYALGYEKPLLLRNPILTCGEAMMKDVLE